MQRRIRKIMRVDKMESLILVSLINTQPETGTPRHCIRGCLNVCGAPIRWHRKFLGITLGCKVLGETTQLFGHWFVYRETIRAFDAVEQTLQGCPRAIRLPRSQCACGRPLLLVRPSTPLQASPTYACVPYLGVSCPTHQGWIPSTNPRVLRALAFPQLSPDFPASVQESV